MTTKALTLEEASTLREALKGGGRQEYVRDWVRRFIEEVAVGERAPEVKMHPLGFLCFPVFRSDEFGCCVHAWLPEGPRAQSPTSDMHMHTFDMISRVLAGTVTNHELELDFDAEPTHRIFAIDKGESEDVDVFSPTNMLAAPRFRPLEKYGPGEQYTILRGRYHTADDTVNDEYTVTFMLAENWWEDEPQRTLVPLDHPEVCAEYHRAALPEPDARRCARIVYDLLS